MRAVGRTGRTKVTGAFVDYVNVPKKIQDEKALVTSVLLLQMTVIIMNNLVYS